MVPPRLLSHRPLKAGQPLLLTHHLANTPYELMAPAQDLCQGLCQRLRMSLIFTVSFPPMRILMTPRASIPFPEATIDTPLTPRPNPLCRTVASRQCRDMRHHTCLADPIMVARKSAPHTWRMPPCPTKFQLQRQLKISLSPSVVAIVWHAKVPRTQ